MENLLAEDLDHVLSHTEGLWEELRGQRIFITGGTGFFGCWLLESFCWANDHLDLRASTTVLTRDSQAFQRKAPHLASHPAVHLQSGDVRSFIFPEGEFSHVIHAATEASAKMSDENPLLMLGTIVDGTRHTLEFARHCGTPKFLLMSSGAVYGTQPPDLTHIPEEYAAAPDQLDPRSTYGEGKRMAEHLCALYSQQYGVETKIARCFAFVGPYLPFDIHFAIGNFIRDGLRGGPIQVKGDGTSFRSYLYAADLTIWLWTILFSSKSCRPYNVGSDEPISILELAHKVVSCLRNRVEVLVMSNPVTGRQPARYVPCIDRGKSELCLRVYEGIENAIRKTISWVELR